MTLAHDVDASSPSFVMDAGIESHDLSAFLSETGNRFYRNTAEVSSVSFLPVPSHSYVLPLPLEHSGIVPSSVAFPELCDSPLRSAGWITILQKIAALRPYVSQPISLIFPEFVSASSFSDILAVANRLSAKELDLPAALASSRATLASPSTGLDVALMRSHEQSILRNGLFPTLASAQSLLFSESLSPQTEFAISSAHPFFSLLHQLAHGSNPVLLPPDFVPNFGRGVSVLPGSIAPPEVILAHFIKEQRDNRVMLVSESIFRTGCRRADVAFSVHNCFVIGKSPVDKHPLGRLLLNTPLINALFKKAILSDYWGPLCPAQLVDLCQKLINARLLFPNVPIYGARRDVDSAYMRVLMHLHSIPLCAILLQIDGMRYVALLLCNHFGLADSNYHFGVLSSFFLHESRSRLALRYPLPISDMLTDDFCVFASLDVITTELVAVGADFHRYLGASAVSVKKDVCATALEMAGAHFDCEFMLLRMTQKGFSTLIHYFFTLAPESPNVGDKFPIKSFQRLGSLAIYYANFLAAGLPFSRGFHQATAAFPLTASTAVWTLRAIGDLFMWRIFLLLSLQDYSWLMVPVYRPVLLRRTHPSETDLDKAFRHAASATAVAYSDGCITNHGLAPNGLGGYQPNPNGFWFSSSIADLSFYSSLHNILLPTDINLIEFIALIITLRCMIYTHILAHGTCYQCHFHIWCDNTSCLSWIRRHRALQPLHYMLLQLFAMLQVHYGVLVTVAHIPGWANVYADAPSRQFHVDGLPHILSVLSQVTPLTISNDFIDDIVSLGTATLVAPSAQALGGLTLLESSIGAISATSMPSPLMAL